MGKEIAARRRLMRRAKEPLRDMKDVQFNGTKPNARWFKPVMFTFFLVGFGWILTYTLTQGFYPIRELGAGNIFAGFGLVMVGFLMSTRWRS